MAKRKALTPEEAAAQRKRHRRQRLIVYPSILALLVGFYYYQPNRIDFIPRHPPSPNPPVDPDAAHLFAKGTRVVIVTAHPDDAEFFLGGTLTQLGNAGADITLIVCTNGDKSFYPWENGEALGKIRQAEQREAYDRWHGSHLYFLGFPDGRLHANDDVKARILELLQQVQPEYILAFDPDYPPRMSHGDHRNSGAAVEAIAKQTSAKWLLKFQTIGANYTVDISRQWPEKEQLLALHRSQFSGKKLEYVTNFVEDMAATAGDRAGFGFGEAYRVLKLK